MLRDKMLRGAVCGVLGNLGKNIVEFFFWKVQWLKHPLSHYAASVFADPNHAQFFGSGLGFVMDYIYGAFLGVILIALIPEGQERFVPIKGLLFGAFIWLFSYSGIRALPMIRLRLAGELDAFLELLVHLIFGLGLGLALERVSRYYRHLETPPKR